MLEFVNCSTETNTYGTLIASYTTKDGKIFHRRSSPAYRSWKAWFINEKIPMIFGTWSSHEMAHVEYQLRQRAVAIILAIRDHKIPMDVIGVIIKKFDNCVVTRNNVGLITVCKL